MGSPLIIWARTDATNPWYGIRQVRVFVNHVDPQDEAKQRFQVLPIQEGIVGVPAIAP